jgi:hypothetical protein
MAVPTLGQWRQPPWKSKTEVSAFGGLERRRMARANRGNRGFCIRVLEQTASIDLKRNLFKSMTARTQTDAGIEWGRSRSDSRKSSCVALVTVQVGWKVRPMSEDGKMGSRTRTRRAIYRLLFQRRRGCRCGLSDICAKRHLRERHLCEVPFPLLVPFPLT